MRLPLFAGLALAAATLTFGPRADAALSVYDGAPDLALTTSMVVAGGGPAHFSSATLYGKIAGDRAGEEAKRLTEQFGAADVANVFTVFDYAVDDVLGIVTTQKIALPKPVPNPDNGPELATALYKSGLNPSGTWDVGYMFDHLISHHLHHVIMMDIDKKYGAPRNERFHIVLAEMMHDLALDMQRARQ